MARIVNIIEYNDETIIEFRTNKGRYRYVFDDWEEAIESLPQLDPDYDSKG